MLPYAALLVGIVIGIAVCIGLLIWGFPSPDPSTRYSHVWPEGSPCDASDGRSHTALSSAAATARPAGSKRT